MSQKLTILNYHGIGQTKNDLIDEYDVTLANFKKQMRLLKICGYIVKSVSNAIETDKKKNSKKVVALTFDDAYKNIYDFSLPLLESNNYTCSIYVVTNFVGKTNGWDKKTVTKEAKIMDWQELEAANAKGHEIGSHGHNHLRLANESDEIVQAEITVADNSIKANLGLNPKSYSFSYGSVNTRALEILEELKYNSALSIKNGRNLKNDRLLLNRVTIKSDDSLLSFWFKVKTGYSPANFAKHLIKFLIGYNKNLHR